VSKSLANSVKTTSKAKNSKGAGDNKTFEIARLLKKINSIEDPVAQNLFIDGHHYRDLNFVDQITDFS
jgi:hypothetical protein